MNILIVDDMAVNRKLLRVMLESRGYTTIDAVNGLEALKVLGQEKVDLIISDILMPEMDGYRLCYEVKKSLKYKNIPIILFTASYTTPEDEKLSLEFGADKFIKKPISTDALIQEIEYVIEHRNEPRPGVLTLNKELEVMKEYSERLVSKLKEKNVEQELILLKLKESEESYRTLAEAAHDAIYVIDRRGVYQYVNTFAAEAFELTPAQMVGKSIYDIFPKEVAQKNQEEIAQVFTNGIPFHSERKFIVKNQEQWVSNQLTPIKGETGSVKSVLGIARDITRRKKMEMELQKSEESYRSLFENMIDAYAYCKIIFKDNEPQDIIYIDVNKEFEKMTGLKDVIGKKITEVIPGVKESNPEFFEIYGRVALTGKPEKFEHYVKYLQRWLSISVYSPEKDNFVSIFENITERKQAEEKVISNEKRLAEAQQLAHLGNYEMVINPETHYWSDELYRICGVTPESFKVHYEGFLDMVHPQDLEIVKKAHLEFRNSHKPFTCEYRIVRPTGEIRNVDEMGEMILNESGEPIRITGIIRDITEQKQAEETLHKQDRIYREAISQADAVPYQRDYKTGKFVFWGEGIKNLTGYSAEELTTEVWKELLQEQIMHGVNTGLDAEDVIQRIYSGEVSEWKADYRIRTRSGETRWLSDSSVQLLDARGKPIGSLGILQDITERKQAEEEIIKFKLGIEHSNDVIFITDMEGNITYTNPTFEKFYGYTPEEVIGKTPRILKSGQLPNEYYREFWETLLSKQEFKGELINKTKAGKIVFMEVTVDPIINSSGKIMGYMAIQRDITERKGAEEKLRDSEVRYRRLFETAKDGILILDEGTGEIVDVNPYLLNLLEYTYEEMLGKMLWEIGPFKNILDSKSAFIELQNKEIIRYDNIPLETKHGKKIEVEFVSNVYDVDHQKVIQCNIRDNSERNEAGAIREVLASLAQKLNEVNTPKEVANIIMTAADALFGWDACWFDLVVGNNLTSILSIDSIDGKRIDVSPGNMDETPESVFQRLLSNGANLILRESPKYDNNTKSFGDKVRPSLSLMFVPVRKMNETVGVLSIQSYSPNAYTQKDLELLQSLADHCGGALERTYAEQEKQIQLKRIVALHDIDIAIASSMDLKVTLNIVLDQVIQQLQVDAAVILQMNAFTHDLKYSVSRGFNTPGIQKIELRLGEGFAGRAALERKTIFISDLEKEKNKLVRFELLQDEKFVSVYCVPLIAKGNIKGVLEVFHRKRLNSTTEWVDYLEVLAGQAAIAIDSSELFSDLQRSNVDLLISYDTTIEGWSAALDLRDKETEGHTKRVTELTLQLARQMNVSDYELVHIRRGALLHDIGKMGIPDNILLKPGKLTDEEWVIMKKHPGYAYDLLYPIPYLRPALDIPYYHHEKWNGTGYPRGLKGEQIPLSARIFAVGDVWDALTSDRPYRPRWSADKAKAHIIAGSGTHFDPRVIEEFLKMEEIQKIS